MIYSNEFLLEYLKYKYRETQDLVNIIDTIKYVKFYDGCVSFYLYDDREFPISVNYYIGSPFTSYEYFIYYRELESYTIEKRNNKINSIL